MASAIEQLTSLVHAQSRYDIPHAELRDRQIEAVNERFQDRKDRIKLLAHRARQAGLSEIRSLEDMVKVLFPHTAYKSYPESFLMDRKWDKLGKWLDTVSTHRVPALDPSTIRDVDDWLAHLEQHHLYVSCSSGTSGKSASRFLETR